MTCWNGIIATAAGYLVVLIVAFSANTAKEGYVARTIVQKEARGAEGNGTLVISWRTV
jgi:hypothetical protein